MSKLRSAHQSEQIFVYGIAFLLLVWCCQKVMPYIVKCFIAIRTEKQIAAYVCGICLCGLYGVVMLWLRWYPEHNFGGESEQNGLEVNRHLQIAGVALFLLIKGLVGMSWYA